MESDVERKNDTKTKFYHVFYKLVEPTVIDMVLEGCGYEENESYKKLSDMCYHKAPPLDNAPENPAHSAHDPAADNMRAPPPYNRRYHDIHQQAYEDNEARLLPPMYTSVAERTRIFEQFLRVGVQPSAPVVSLPMQAPMMNSLPPPYQTNPTPYVLKDLYSLPPPADVPPTSFERDGNDAKTDKLMELFIKLELLRDISKTVNKRREEAHREERKMEKEMKKDIKRQEASNVLIRGFPKHWPRSDRGATIIPVKGDRRTEIANIVKNMRLKVEIQAIEELCNFNIFEQFVVQKHCIEEQKKPLNEKQLWYYARLKDVENICYQGINFKQDLNTGSIGVGKYFFLKPESAHKARSENLQKGDIAYMFLCDVNAGKMVKGHSENDFVPIDEDGFPYESSVDNIINPTMFILHEKNNCYPRYMITYKVKSTG